MKKLMSDTAAPLIATSLNILIVFVVYTLCRVEFLAENYSYFSHIFSEGTWVDIFRGGIVLDTPGIFYTNALYILLMLLPLHVKEREGYYRMCKWVFIVINSVAVTASLADSVYFPFTLRRTSAEIFSEFANENNLGSIVGKSIISKWYLLIVGAGLIWGMWKLYVSPRPDRRRLNKVKYYIVGTLALAAAAVTVVSGIRGGLLNHWWYYLIAAPMAYAGWKCLTLPGLRRETRAGGWVLCAGALILVACAPIGGWRHRDIRPVTLSNANKYISRPVEAARGLNTPFSVCRTLGSQVFVEPAYFASAEEAEKVFSPLHTPVAPDSARLRGHNVVVIIIESFGREYIGGFSKEILGEDYKGYTPFTDSLMRASATWRFSYANGRKSIDGMPSVLASVPMMVKPFILTAQSLNRVEGLPAQLGREGYSTAFFHGARTGSMGFDSFARSIGFQEYYGREDYQADPRMGGEKDFDGYWAIWDKPFMQYYALKMSEMKQPFMTAIFTATSHHPFQIPEEDRGRYPEGTLPIHKCIGYTDNALREFFNTARKQPWFDNTIFIITSDHTNMSDHEEYKSALGSALAPLIIYDPSGAVAPGMRDAIAQQIDIMPTVLNLTGASNPYIGYGFDLLSTPDEDTWAFNFLNGTYQYAYRGLVLQFDGERPTALYSLTDWTMTDNLLGRPEYADRQQEMELRLKAMIQSYMHRMLNDSLTPGS